MKERFLNGWAVVGGAWNRFWFEPVDIYPLALFRFFFGIGAAIFYGIRMTDYSFYFGEDGMIPFDLLRLVVPTSYTSPVPWEWLAKDPRIGLVLHGLLVAGLVAVALGWVGRKGTWVVFMLHLVFLKRNPLITYGADMSATFWLLYLCLTRTDGAFRIALPGVLSSKWIAPGGAKTDLFSTVGFRLLQVQLMIIYAYSGLEKLRGLTWWQGDAIWNTLANGQLVTMDLSFLVHVPALVAVMTFFTVVWELYFPFLVWVRPIRKFVLIFGVALHVGIGITMNIPGFSYFMISAYFVFLDGTELRAWTKRILPRRLATARATG